MFRVKFHNNNQQIKKTKNINKHYKKKIINFVYNKKASMKIKNVMPLNFQKKIKII